MKTSSMTKIAAWILAILALPALTHAAPWLRTYGGPDQEFPAKITPNTDGTFYLLAGTRSYGAGETDCLFARLTNSGVSVWAKAIGEKGDDILTAVPAADGGYFVGGHTTSFGLGNPAATNYNVYFGKFDSSWRAISQKVWGGTKDETAEFDQTTDGGFLFRGSSASYTTSDTDLRDVFLFKAATNGAMVWRKVYHFGNNDMVGDTAELADGYVLAFLTAEGDVIVLKTSKDTGDLLWKRKFHASGVLGLPKLERTLDGGVLASMSLSTGFDSRILLAKLSGSGAMVWRKTYSHASSGVVPVSVTERTDASLIVAGTLLKPVGSNFVANALVMRLTSGGTVLVQTELAAAGLDLTADIASGGALWYGVSYDPVETNFDAVCAKLNKTTLMPAWARSFGGPEGPETGIAYKQGTQFIFSGHTESEGTASPGKGNVFGITLTSTGFGPSALSTLSLKGSPAKLKTLTATLQSSSVFTLVSRTSLSPTSVIIQIKPVALN
jgi:hypothetical protein